MKQFLEYDKMFVMVFYAILRGVTCLNKVLKNLSIYLLIVLAIIALIRYTTPNETITEPVTYSRFLEELDQGKVAKVVIQSENMTNIITGERTDGTRFETKGPATDTALYAFLKEKKVEWNSELPPQPGWWTRLFTTLLTILLFVILFFF